MVELIEPIPELKDIEKRALESLTEWGFDVAKFEARAKQSLERTRGDIGEITGTLRQALLRTKLAMIELEKAKEPVADELKKGFERAWNALEESFIRARLRMRTPELEESLRRAEADPDWWS